MDLPNLATDAPSRSRVSDFGFDLSPLTDEQCDRDARINHMRALARTIEGEIIPRLLLVHAIAKGTGESERSERGISEDEVAEFADMVIARDPIECIAHVEAIHQRGAALETIFLDLLSATARRLGALWVEDLRTFTDVTIALGTLQQVFRHFAPTFEVDGPAEFVGVSRRRAFLVPAPGEQHTFGLFMLETFLHRAGWLADAMPIFDTEEVRLYLRSTAVDVIGISASCEKSIIPVTEAIRMMRQASLNKRVIVLAGGAPFVASPQLFQEAGADATAVDANDAVAKVNRLVPLPLGDETRRQIN